MFHRKRFRLATVITMVLLLTIASTSVAAAHASLPLSDDIQRDPPPIPTGNNGGGGTTLPPGGGGGQTSTPTGGGQTSTSTGGGQTSTSTGGGVAPPATVNGLIKAGDLPVAAPQCDCAACRHPHPAQRLPAPGCASTSSPATAPVTSDPSSIRSASWPRTYPTDAVTLYSGSKSGNRQTRYHRIPAGRKKAPRQHFLRR